MNLQNWLTICYIKFNSLGLDLVELSVEALILQKNLERLIRKVHNKLNGWHGQICKEENLDAMNMAAANEGGGSFAGMGAGLGRCGYWQYDGNVFSGQMNQQPLNTIRIQRQPRNNMYRL